MRKILMIMLLITTFVAAHGQKKKKGSEKTEAAKPAETPAVQPVAPKPDTSSVKMNPFIEHFYRKYNLATRWNDLAAAKDALYDLIVETGSDSLVYTLGVYYYDNQQYAPSALIAKDLLARKPKDPVLLQLGASSFEGLGLTDKALPMYETLFLVTDNTAVLYKMATLQFDTKLYAEAQANVDILMTKQDIDKLTVSVTGEGNSKQYPLKVALLNVKGLLAQQAGNKALAKKSFEDALAIAPDFRLAKENLAKIK